MNYFTQKFLGSKQQSCKGCVLFITSCKLLNIHFRLLVRMYSWEWYFYIFISVMNCAPLLYDFLKLDFELNAVCEMEIMLLLVCLNTDKPFWLQWNMISVKYCHDKYRPLSNYPAQTVHTSCIKFSLKVCKFSV